VTVCLQTICIGWAKSEDAMKVVKEIVKIESGGKGRKGNRRTRRESMLEEAAERPVVEGNSEGHETARRGKQTGRPSISLGVLSRKIRNPTA